MQRTLAVAGAIIAPMLLAPAVHAGPVIFYEQTFESDAVENLPEWTGFVFIANNEYLTRFMGPSAQKSTTLTVPIPSGLRDTGTPGGGDDGGGGGDTSIVFSIEFDLFIIDSWGYSAIDPGDDHFRVGVDGVNAFDEIFSNTIGIQTFRAPDERGSYAYNTNYEESIYRDVKIVFTPAEGQNSVTFEFFADTTQPWQDESYGIDNVRVGYEVVPAPGPLAMLGLGGVALCSRRRRG